MVIVMYYHTIRMFLLIADRAAWLQWTWQYLNVIATQRSRVLEFIFGNLFRTLLTFPPVQTIEYEHLPSRFISSFYHAFSITIRG